MRSNRKKEWSCILCGHRYEAVSLGETCPRDGGVLLENEVRAKYKNDPLLGKCIDDRYQLIDILGVGGFGTVYRCFDTRRRTEFAFKTIADHKLLNQNEVRQRFLQEGRLLAKLNSAYVVKVYETGEADDTLYMVLELVKGLSLKQSLNRKNKLPLAEASAVIVQVLIPLEHSHNAGLIHRDLKPSNILFTDLDAKSLKLIDFGIAKPLNSQGDNGPKTRAGLVIGTVQYMAPEQLRTDLPVGPQADLYATGILFYEILSGKSPFTGSQAEVAAGHLYQIPEDLDPGLGIPDAVTQWLHTALSKEPNERFSDALNMRMELRGSLGASEQGLKTTLPVADDTIKMAPDLPFMRSFGLTEVKASAVAAKVKEENHNHAVIPTENEALKPMVSHVPSTTNAPREIEGIAAPENSKQARTQSGRQVELRQSNEDTIQNIVEPKATQKLTPLELLRASNQSQKPMSIGALIPDEENDHPRTPMTGNTQLEDVPEALLGYDSGPNGARTAQRGEKINKETSSDEQNRAPQAPLLMDEDIPNYEEKAGVFKVGMEAAEPSTGDSLFSGFTGWWMLPIFLVVGVGLLAVYLW